MNTPHRQQVEQHHMNQVVHHMTSTEAHQSHPRGTCMECPVAREKEVIDKRHNITYGIGNIYLYELHHQHIHPIMDASRHTAIHTETKELSHSEMTLI